MLTVLFILCCLSTSYGEFQIVFIHANDLHAKIEQTNQFGASCSQMDAANDKCYGGVSRMWTKIKELREQYTDNSLLLDAGDQFQGTLWSSHYRGNETIFFMNYLQYDVMTLGNHEFDYGLDTLRRFVDHLSFPVVVSNLDPGNTVLKGAYDPSHIFTINQKKVGIIGYIGQNFDILVGSGLGTGLTVTDEVEAVRKEAIRLKSQGVDIIIALGHSDFDVSLSVAQLDEVNIVICGHSHTLLYTGDPPSRETRVGDYPIVVEKKSGDKSLVVQAYAFGKYMGFLKVNFTDNGKVSSWEGQPILLDSSVIQDPELLKEVDEMDAFLESLENEVVGETYVFLGSSTMATEYSYQEFNIGNLVTDAMIWSYVYGRRPVISGDQTLASWSDVAVAVWNNGAIRTQIQQGPITMAVILEVLPFDETLVIVEVTGNTILKMFEHSAEASDSSSVPRGAFLQTSGIQVTYDQKRPAGERVVSLMIKCTKCSVPQYEPLDKQRSYKVLVSSFLAEGGDGYSMLQEEWISRIELDTLPSNALKDYIEKFSPIIQSLAGRIQYI